MIKSFINFHREMLEDPTGVGLGVFIMFIIFYFVTILMLLSFFSII